MREKRREKAAQSFIRDQLGLASDVKPSVLNSWGPYTSTDGTAKSTGVPGM
jgi:hypothetical protein